MNSKQKEHWTKLGVYFGFPTCCIEQFCDNNNGDREKRSKAGNGTGLLPCTKHAKQINSGKIKLKDLIQNREHPEEFPKT